MDNIMKRNDTLLIALLFSALLLFTGCAQQEKSPAEPAPAAQAPAAGPAGSEKEPEIAAPEQPAAPAAQKAEAEPSEPAVPEASEQADAAQTPIRFGPDQTVSKDGFCEMSGLYAEVLDDAAVAEGWYYYYTDTDESPADILVWTPSEPNHTTLEALFSVKNTSGSPQSFADRITAQLLYQQSAEHPVECFEGTVFQQNPGQVEKSGEIILWSVKPVKVAAGESVSVSFRFDIPKDVYEKVYATAVGEPTGIWELCVFRFDDGTEFEIDLSQVLIPASQYTFE